MISPFHSIRWRVQAWHGLILLLVIMAFCTTAYRLALATQLRRIDAEMVRSERGLFFSLIKAAEALPPPERPEGDKTHPQGPPPNPAAMMIERLRRGEIKLPADQAAVFQGKEPGHLYFVIQHAEGKLLAHSENAPEAPDFLPTKPGDLNEDTRTIGDHRELRRANNAFRFILGRDISPEMADIHRFGWSLSALGGGVWLLGLLGGWWLAGRAIRPIDAISRTATRIAEGNLTERIGSTKTDSELDQLCQLLDRTFERLRSAIEQQKQFTADASHELRTPVTILLAETQRVLKKPRSAEEYREAIEVCRKAALRMRSLTEALLTLARQENGPVAEKQALFDPAASVREVLSGLEPLAKAKSLESESELTPCSFSGNEEAFRLLASNLISNAIHHNRTEGKFGVRCFKQDTRLVLEVWDNGPGIPLEDQPHVFERFYRADKARSAENAHAGIGLAIVKTIVDRHGGQLHLESHPGQGTRIRIEL